MGNPELSKSTLPQSSPRTVIDYEDGMGWDAWRRRDARLLQEATNLTFLPSHTFWSLETASPRPKPKQPAAEPV